MAVRELHKLRRRDLIDFLNSALIGSVNIAEGADVDDETFIVDIGGGNVTVTFAPALSRDWTPQEIADKINSTLGVTAASVHLVGSGLVPRPPTTTMDRRLKVAYGTLTVRSTGTGNAKLGFSTTSDTVGGAIPPSEVESLFLMKREQDTWNLILYR